LGFISKTSNQCEPDAGEGASSQAINSMFSYQLEPSAGDRATSQAISSMWG